MRKLTALLLALITSLSLAACSFVALPMDPEQPTNQKQEQLAEDGTYTTKEDVARYIHLYGHLPDNFITKKEAQQLGWTGGSLEPYAPGCCIGGSRFGNYEGLLPEADGRTWTECDINTQGARSRGPERIVFSNREQLHDALSEALELPEWYGRSLDALYDCLTDLSVPTTIHVEHWPQEDYLQRALTVIQDAAEENELIQVRLED